MLGAHYDVYAHRLELENARDAQAGQQLCVRRVACGQWSSAQCTVECMCDCEQAAGCDLRRAWLGDGENATRMW